MKKIILLVLFSFVSLSLFAAEDTFYYCEHKGGINGGWLASMFKYIPDPLNASFTEEMWNKNHQEFLSSLQHITVDNSSAIIKEVMRCPNSRHDLPRFKVVNGQIVPTENVLDVSIPPGFKGVNPDGTLIPE